jgi:tRNA uridine 5-carboxymethylaminomethyl modification enzyme
MEFNAGKYHIAVIGAGHAGCEAALAGARLGMKTLIVALNLEAIAMLACNPSIGGTSKGHLVREVDALGGEMGINIDKSLIQIRMLNTGKGPAVHSLRAQADKHLYHREMKRTLENQENLTLIQGEVEEIRTRNGKVEAVKLATGQVYYCDAVVVASGVYLKSRIIIGEYTAESGPSGLYPARSLSRNLRDLGFTLYRFKTGTPARVNSRSLDFSKMIVQPGDPTLAPFSFMNDPIKIEQVPCYLTYTNEATHEIIRKNLHRSPLYSGVIEGVGARYCPSIEDKIVRFPEKKSHQIFLEPEGLYTNEYYVQGMSSSLPVDVQIDVYRTIPGMENVEIMRPAYAIEYDCIDSTQLKLSLESKEIKGLFFAGQINGSSGYEEAAAQGIMAGINAVQYLKNEEPLILDRSDAYIGVLIDDLATKGTPEPYRMMTSRAEYRLLLRQDNADLRLTEKGYKIGLVTEERYRRFMAKKEGIEKDKIIIEENKDDYIFYTYAGNRVNYTLATALSLINSFYDIVGVNWKGFKLRCRDKEFKINLDIISEEINKIRTNPDYFDKEKIKELIERVPDIATSKFQRYLPQELRRKQLFDYIYDIEKTKEFVKENQIKMLKIYY